MAKASPAAKKKISRPKKKASQAAEKSSSPKRPTAPSKSDTSANIPLSSMEDVERKHGLDLRAEAVRLEKATAQERVTWALETFPKKIAMSSSFGAQSAVSLHMLTLQHPGIPVILVDTGYFFPETYRFIEQLTERLSLNLQVYSNPLTPAWQEATFGKLWEDGVEGLKKYNDMNKVEPMNRALDDLQVEALFSGLRRQQSDSRKSMPVVVSQRGRIKIHPIVDWTDMEVGMYLVENDLPYHPLWDEGYVSIGDWHTTRKLTDGMSEEETRFFGLKRECGLNEDVDFQI
jgi:phosphoadenosine phosphosulfate reductase